eukprot:s1616_g20.t1
MRYEDLVGGSGMEILTKVVLEVLKDLVEFLVKSLKSFRVKRIEPSSYRELRCHRPVMELPLEDAIRLVSMPSMARLRGTQTLVRPDSQSIELQDGTYLNVVNGTPDASELYCVAWNSQLLWEGWLNNHKVEDLQENQHTVASCYRLPIPEVLKHTVLAKAKEPWQNVEFSENTLLVEEGDLFQICTWRDGWAYATSLKESWQLKDDTMQKCRRSGWVPIFVLELVGSSLSVLSEHMVQVEVVELAESIADLLKPEGFGDWVLVDDSFPPLAIQEFNALRALQRFKGLEDGYPDLPEECLRIVARSLACGPEEVVDRAYTAYVSGFLAKIALATSTPFERRSKAEDPEILHWVVFYRHTPDINRRVTSKKCLEIAITVEEDCIWEGFRPGGALYAVPDKLLSGDQLLDAMTVEEPGLLGPSREFSAQLMVEEDVEGGIGIVDLPTTAVFLVVDLEDSALAQMREYDPVTDFRENIVPFLDSEPNALPKVAAVLTSVHEWIDAISQDRLNFYSAREEQAETPPAPTTKRATPKKAARVTIARLSAQMVAMQQQLQAVMAQQDILSQTPAPARGSASPAGELANGPAPARMPPLSASLTGGIHPKTAAGLVGPPPRTKAAMEPPATDVDAAVHPIPGSSGNVGEGSMAHALSQQSFALTQLVAHLTGGGDAMADLASSSNAAGLSLNTKGVARREKMQSDLALRSSNYFLQVQQQLYKRMNPAKVVPKSSQELAQSDVSMTAYLERYGGFKSCRDTGLIMWILAHAVDAASMDDFHATKEYIALLVASMEQSALDGGWNVAYILSLMEEPPQQLFSERLQPMASSGRPFAPLVPPQWAAVALSYLKEIEVLSTRKVEMRKPFQKAAAAPSTDPAAPASPKRKPRFPKKPKGGGEESP